MKHNYLLLFLIINITVVKSQDICIGQRLYLHSHTLNEKREILIHLPEHYCSIENSTSQYPVLYVLDGEKLFNQTVAVVEALSGGLYRYMPETIVVGIVNTDRSRDLTPSNDTILHNNIPIHTTSGGAYDFLNYICTELGDYINLNYRTNGYNMLSGHSFGGLFTIYAFLNQSSFFNASLAHDPSLWWDDKTLINQLEDSWDNFQFNGTSLYLSVAAIDTTEKDRFHHTESIMHFHDFIDKNPKQYLNFIWEHFKTEDHGTIPLPATFNGLRAIFEGITLPVKKIPYNTQLIKEKYQQLSDKLGQTFIPEAELLDRLAVYCRRVKQNQAELEIRKMQVQYYPNSAYTHSELAKIYYKSNLDSLSDQHQAISDSIKTTTN